MDVNDWDPVTLGNLGPAELDAMGRPFFDEDDILEDAELGVNGIDDSSNFFDESQSAAASENEDQ